MNVEMSLFVPAALGAGLLVSILALLRDAAHRLHGERWIDRRSAMNGRAAALLVARGELAARGDMTGRRARRVYVTVGVGFCGLGAYLTAGAYGNYIGWTGWVHTIAWIWLAYLVFIAAFFAVGAASLAVAVSWSNPPAWTRPFMTHTPLSTVEPHPRSLRERRPLHVRHPDRLTSARTPDLLDARAASALRMIASLWSMLAVVILSMLAFQDRLPQAPDPAIFETAISGPLQIGLLALVTIGSIFAGRSEATGAALIAIAAAALALLSAIQYPPHVALILSVALGAPALLHWLAWQRDRHLHHVLVLAVVTSLLVGVVAVGADRLYAAILGPSHPESLTVLEPSTVEWMWAGGTTSRSTSVTAKLQPHLDARLAITDGQDTPNAPLRFVTGRHVTEEIIRFDIADLAPSTSYRYAMEVDGVLDGARTGTVTTFPEGAASFDVAVGSCARTGSNGQVYDAIRQRQPLAYVALGDINYANIRGDDLPRFLRAWDRTLDAPSQSALYRSTSVAYMWDDHDYGGNDADLTSPSRAAAQTAYRLVVPHYPFGAEPSDGATYQAFTIGRVRFVLTDLRSHRRPATGEDEESEAIAEKTMMGATQLAWFEAELRAAAERQEAIVWLSSSPWIEAEAPGSDAWGGFAEERQHIASIVRALELGDRLLMVAGDAHMAAYDDGGNAAYDGPGSGFPVLHAGALDRPGGVKGGPFSGGTFPGAGHYGNLRVDDSGADSLRITLSGNTWDGRVLLEQTVTLRLE